MRDDRRMRFPLGNRVQLEELSRNPYPVLKALQEREPVSWIGELQAWFVTRRADCLAILLDSTTSSVASSASLLEDTLGQTMLSTDGVRQRQLRQPFADPLALWTVMTVLGLPFHDFPTVRGWFTDIAHALGNFVHDLEVRERGRVAASAFGDYAAIHLARLRREPTWICSPRLSRRRCAGSHPCRAARAL